MYEETCYRHNFLKQVIARVDFFVPIELPEKSLPARLTAAIAKHFPIAEPPAITIAQGFQIGDGAIKPVETKVKEWNFFSKDRDSRLCLSAGSMFVEYKRYETYDRMKAEIGFALDALAATYPDAQAGRFGLRFVNQIEIDEVKRPSQWSKYVAGPLLALPDFLTDETPLTRVLHLVEMKFDELDLRLQCGMPNADYPAVMKRPSFLIDMDSYVQAAHPIGQVAAYMDIAHTRIQALFEQSITDALREKMNAEVPGV